MLSLSGVRFLLLTAVGGAALQNHCDAEVCTSADTEGASLLQTKNHGPLPQNSKDKEIGPSPIEDGCKVWGVKNATGMPNNLAEMCSGAERDNFPIFDDGMVFKISVITGPLSAAAGIRKLFPPLLEIISYYLPGTLHADLYFEGPDGHSFSIGYFNIKRDGNPVANLIYGGIGRVSWMPDPCTNQLNYFDTYTQFEIGSATGAILNKWFDFVVDYQKSHMHYNSQGLANQGKVSSFYTRWIEGSDCSSFIEESIIALWKLDAKFMEDVLVCRVYIDYISHHPPFEVPYDGLTHWRSSSQELFAAKQENVAKINDLDKHLNKLYKTRNYSDFRDALSRRTSASPKIMSYENGNGTMFYFYPAKPAIFPNGPGDMVQRAILPYQPESGAVANECDEFTTTVWANFDSSVPYWASDEYKKREDAVCPQWRP